MSSRRSRKSQTQQARKSKKGGLSKWLVGGFAILLLLLVIGLILGYQAVRSYLKSDDFRVRLGDQAGETLGGEALFQPFIWDGWAVRTERLNFKSEGPLQGFEVADINASVDIGSVWDGVYRVENVTIRKVDLDGDFRERESVADQKTAQKAVPVTSESLKPFWESWLPTEVEVTGLTVGSLSGTVLTDDGEWLIDGASVEVSPGSIKGNYEATLRDAEVTSPIELLKNLKLREARARYTGDHFHLLSSTGRAFERGHLTLNGEYDLTESDWEFLGDLTGVRLDEMLPEDWKQRLIGDLKVDFKAYGKKEADPVLSGSLEIDRGTLTALPFLDNIAAYTNTERFRRLALSEATLDFEKQGKRLELKNIKLASEGLVRLEGDLILEGDVIRSGRFQLGITPGTLIYLPGAETKVFQRGKMGLLWAPLNIGGTLDFPTEDLSDRLIEAAGERMFELIPQTGEWALKYSGEQIGDATKDLLKHHGVILGVTNSILGSGKTLIEKGTDSIDDVIEKGTDAVEGATESAVNSIFDLLGRPIEKKK